MEKRSKATQKKAEARPKKTDKPEKPDTTTTDNHNLDSKLQLWKQNSKELKHFEFLNLQLYSEYLTLQRTNTANTSQTDGSPKLKNAVKYLSLIKYIDQHSDPHELDAVLHNISFMYEIDKETLKTEALTKKKSIKKSPKSMSISQYLNSLIEVDMKKAGLVKSGELEVFLLPVKVDGEIVKELVGVENDEVVAEKKGKSRGAKKSKLEEATQRQAEVSYPLRKRVKGNNTSAAAEGNSETMPVIKQEEEKENPKEVKEKEKEKEKASKSKKQTKSKKKDNEDSDDEDDPIANMMPEQYMEIKINNPIDDDDGDSFSFFYVNENIYNKTKHYFEKKLDPGEVCNCPGACNDPLICPCARANFEQSGKTSCYVYDSKYGKKRLLHQLIKKDQHIYECSANCACAKSMCLNSCVNESERNRFNVDNFIVERIKKEYKGDNPKLKDFSSTMWGLRTKVFIPTNTYVVEYCGEIITKKEGDKRGEKYDAINCNYLFDLNKHAEIEKVEDSSNTVYMNVDGVCEARSTNKLKDLRENFPLVIDAFFYGNHSRFVNHSCSPNMVALAVHIENRDILLPRIIYFALRDIQPGEELTIDYNCAPLKDLKNTELLVCLCGAEACRGYVYEEAEDSDAE